MQPWKTLSPIVREAPEDPRTTSVTAEPANAPSPTTLTPVRLTVLSDELICLIPLFLKAYFPISVQLPKVAEESLAHPSKTDSPTLVMEGREADSMEEHSLNAAVPAVST